MRVRKGLAGLLTTTILARPMGRKPLYWFTWLGPFEGFR